MSAYESQIVRLFLSFIIDSSLQALMDNAKKQNLLKKVDKELGHGIVQLLICFALLPKKLIKEGFHLIKHVILNEKTKEMEHFLNYYEKTWLDTFKPDAFSVYGQKHRTNNVSERHNRELKKTLKKHSTVLQFLGVL